MNEWEQCISEWAERCQERDQTIAALRQEIERLTQELEQCRGNYEIQRHAADQAEQERDRLKAALEQIAENPHLSYADNATPYDIGVADGHRCAARWAQQAIGQKEQP